MIRYVYRFIIIYSLFLFLSAHDHKLLARGNCHSDRSPRLVIGEPGQVTPEYANRVRSNPSSDAELLGVIPAGRIFLVLDGPICSDNYMWWEIYTFYETGNVITGWTAEGDNANYWLEPISPNEFICERQYDLAWSDDVAYVELGVKAAKEKHFETSVAFFTCAIEYAENSTINFLYERGLSFLALENYEAALADFNNIIQQDPTRYLAYISRARAYFGMGNIQQGLDEIDWVLREFNDSFARYNAFLARGEIHLKLQDYAYAQTDYERALQEEMYGVHSPVPPLIGLGDAFNGQGNFASAIHAYYRALLILKDNDPQATPVEIAETHLRLARAYDLLNLYSPALGHYQHYLSELAADDQTSVDSEVSDRVHELEAQNVVTFYPDTDTSPQQHIGTEAQQLNLEEDYQECTLDWSSDNQFLLYNNRIFSPFNTIEPIQEFGSEQPIEAVFSPDGRVVAASYADKIRLWNANSGELLIELLGTQSVAFSPDGQLLAFVGSDNTLFLWDIIDASLQKTFSGHTDSITSLVFSPDKRLIASTSDWGDGTIRQWNIETGEQITQFQTNSAVYDADFSPDGNILLTGDYYYLTLWDMKMGTPLGIFYNHTLTIDNVSFLKDGTRFAAITGTKVTVWDITTGQKIEEFQETAYNNYSMGCFAISDNSQYLAVRVDYSDIYIWALTE